MLAEPAAPVPRWKKQPRLALGAGLAALLAAVVGFVIVRSKPEEVRTISPALAEPARLFPPNREVRFSGCRLVRKGGVCERMEAEPLVIWLPGVEEGEVRFTTEFGPCAIADAKQVAGGLRIRLRPPFSARLLRLWRGERSPWQLALREHVPFAWEESANRLRHGGKLDEAAQLAAAGTSSLNAEESSRARAMLARIALSSGKYEEAAAGLSETATDASRFGRVSDALSDLLALNFVQTQYLRELGVAGATLARAKEQSKHDPGRRSDWHYHAGVHASALGDPWSARTQYREARDEAERLALGPSLRAASVELAKVDLQLGRTADALASMRSLVQNSQDASPCVLGRLNTNLSWVEMVAIEHGHAVRDVDAHLRAATALNEQCGAPHIRRIDRINLGLRAAQRGDARRAREEWEVLRSRLDRPTPWLQLWEQELEGQVELLEGNHAQALTAFAREGALAHGLGDWDGMQRAWVGQGIARERSGQTQAALEAYARAGELLTEASKSVPLGVARDGFAGSHDLAALRLLDGLLRHDRVAEGFAVALQTYQQSFFSAAAAGRIRQRSGSNLDIDRSVENYQQVRAQIDREAERDWELSHQRLEFVSHDRARRIQHALQAVNDEYRRLDGESDARVSTLPLRDGVTSFLILPGLDRWRVLMHSSGRVRFVAAQASDSQADAGAWLGSFDAELRNAKSIRFMPYGAAHGVDWARVTWRGQPLINAFDIAYGLGLPSTSSGTSGASRVLVVADPTSDLPNARKDAFALSARLKPGNHVFLAGAQARRDLVLQELARADLFYYAGHGQAAALLDHAGLLFADGTTLTPTDVLLLPRVPRFVVLAACDAGTSEREPMGGGWSLAHAFLIAGAEQVIAPVTPIGDAEAARVTGSMVDSLLESKGLDLVTILSKVQRDLRYQSQQAARSFRVFVR